MHGAMQKPGYLEQGLVWACGSGGKYPKIDRGSTRVLFVNGPCLHKQINEKKKREREGEREKERDKKYIYMYIQPS